MTADRHRDETANLASCGRKISWPVAELAGNIPNASPRCDWNQRCTTVAPSTMAMIPVPDPTTTPHRAANTTQR